MEKRQNGGEVQKNGRDSPWRTRHSAVHVEKCADMLEEVILGHGRARRCAAAVKGEVMMEVSDGQGQAARACEEKGFKAKTWVIGGLSGAQALLLALHHLSRRARLSAVLKSWTSPCQRGW